MAWKRFGSEGDGGKRLGEILKGFSFRNIKKDQLLLLFLAGVLLLVISLPTDGRKKSSGGGRAVSYKMKIHRRKIWKKP